MTHDIAREASLYERIMGERFMRLAAPVQAFHRLQGRHVLHGEVRTRAADGFLARWLGRTLGTPMAASVGEIAFELDAQPAGESWVRCFPGKTMRSRLTQSGSLLQERLGAARLLFELDEDHASLVMRLHSLYFLGVPCPAWLMPRIVAVESNDAGNFHFTVQARVAGIGVVARYEGHLVVPLIASDAISAAPAM